MKQAVYVIAEHDKGRINRITREVFAFSLELAWEKNLPVEFIILGDDIMDMADEIAQTTGKKVNALIIPHMDYYNGELYVSALESFLKTRPPAYICLGGTARGGDFTPALGVRLKAASVSSVRGFSVEEGKLSFIRPIENGRRLAHVKPLTGQVILGIQPGVYKPADINPKSPGEVSTETLSLKSPAATFTGLLEAEGDTSGLTEAEVIVAVGNGIGDGEGLDHIRRFADIFPKSAVAGSRIVCDRGLLPYPCQVGITGATVSPGLYIACGISGASQHMGGMSGAGFVVAINTDPGAPIMQAADVCINEDMTEFLPLVADECKGSDSNNKGGVA